MLEGTLSLSKGGKEDDGQSTKNHNLFSDPASFPSHVFSPPLFLLPELSVPFGAEGFRLTIKGKMPFTRHAFYFLVFFLIAYTNIFIVLILKPSCMVHH